MRYSNAMYREVFPEVVKPVVQPTIESAVDTFRPSDDKTIETQATTEPQQEVVDLETVVEPGKGVENGNDSTGSGNATD